MDIIQVMTSLRQNLENSCTGYILTFTPFYKTVIFTPHNLAGELLAVRAFNRSYSFIQYLWLSYLNEKDRTEFLFIAQCVQVLEDINQLNEEHFNWIKNLPASTEIAKIADFFSFSNNLAVNKAYFLLQENKLWREEYHAAIQDYCCSVYTLNLGDYISALQILKQENILFPQTAYLLKFHAGAQFPTDIAMLLAYMHQAQIPLSFENIQFMQDLNIREILCLLRGYDIEPYEAGREVEENHLTQENFELVKSLEFVLLHQIGLLCRWDSPYHFSSHLLAALLVSSNRELITMTFLKYIKEAERLPIPFSTKEIAAVIYSAAPEQRLQEIIGMHDNSAKTYHSNLRLFFKKNPETDERQLLPLNTGAPSI